MKPRPISIEIGRTGRVTLKIDADQLAGIVDDAAQEEGRRHSQPNRDNVVAIADALAEWFLRWNDDAGQVYIAYDVRKAYGLPSEPAE